MQQLLQQAIALHRAGRLAEAEAAYRQALLAAPSDYAVLYLLGSLCLQTGRVSEALTRVEAALRVQPAGLEALVLRASALQAGGRDAEALAAFSQVLAINPDLHETLFNRGTLLGRAGRQDEALRDFDRVVGLRPDLAPAWNERGMALQELHRYTEAVQSYDRAIALMPGHAGPYSNRGAALRALKRPQEALASYDQALAISQDYPAAFYNRGVTLWELSRFEEALAAYDRALTLKPDYADAWNNRGLLLERMGRFAQSLDSYDHALALRPNDAGTLYNRGLLLLEMDRIGEGLDVLSQRARMVHGKAPPGGDEPAHKRRHDAEQQDYLAARRLGGGFRLEGGARLAGAAINPANTEQVTARWQAASPQIVVIDDLLTPAALDALRDFCWGSTVWRKPYAEGYLGALLEHGFACPLLGQIAEELRATYPAIFHDHPLRYLWGFKYDSSLAGIRIHADKAAVNVNFWIAPDEANRDPASGGLVIWDKAAPLDWDFARYNADEAAARAFLAREGATPITVPHRANRAVIFDSDLFHETDKIDFAEGYTNRRTNVTLLYGRRTADDVK